MNSENKVTDLKAIPHHKKAPYLAKIYDDRVLVCVFKTYD